MKLNSLLTNLALIGLSSVNVNADNNEDVSIQESNFCKLDVNQQVSPSCDITFKEINEINKKIRPDLVSLVQTEFFRYFKIDLYKECSFWDTSDAFCTSRNCAVDVVEDWDKLPEIWQPEVLGSLNNETVSEATEENDNELTFLNQLCDKSKSGSTQKVGSQYDYCDLDDFSKEGSVLVDLVENPERFTGYGGNQSASIWMNIYNENCFTVGETGQSLAKDAFYRLVSGLHASIATHLSNGYLNTDTGNFEPNLDLFMARVGNFPDRVANIYFDYSVISKALWKIRPYMKRLSFCDSYDEKVKSIFLNIVSQLDSKIFNEDLIFSDNISSKLKDDFKLRFKNVTRLMDCVHCDRCRMWGKIQTTGYATSLKILFELDQHDEETKQHIVDKLTKYELIALINTFDRLSQSIAAINNFETLYNQRLNSSNNTQNKLANFFQNNNFFKLLGSARKAVTSTITSIKANASKGGIKASEEKDTLIKEKEEQVVFADLKMPKKKTKQLDSNGTEIEGVWEKAWKTEIHNFKEALRFIYRCYADLPSNVWNICLYNMNKLWNRFVGVANYVKEEEDNPIAYSLDIQ